MQTRFSVAALFCVSIAFLPACGGGKKVSNARSPGGEGDDPATPFYDGAVKASLRSAAGNAECGVAPGTTMGAHFDAQKQAIRANGMLVEESFRCRARSDDRWDCEWALSGVPSETTPAEPSAENPCGGENPCAGEGGGGFMIMATVGNDGSVNPKDIHCVAPG